MYENQLNESAKGECIHMFFGGEYSFIQKRKGMLYEGSSLCVCVCLCVCVSVDLGPSAVGAVRKQSEAKLERTVFLVEGT